MRRRRIKAFSERDRVRLGALPDGAEFLWRGARWVKHVREGGPTQVSLRVTGGFQAGPRAVPTERTRVLVSRASGHALHARLHAQEGAR